MESITVVPNDTDSVETWKKHCSSVILQSNLPNMLKWSLWAQASNSNVWYQDELRAFFYSAVVKSYLKLDTGRRVGVLVSSSEQFTRHLYQLCAARLGRDFESHQQASNLTREEFSDFFTEVYLTAADAAAEPGNPTIDEFCKVIRGMPNTTEASRKSMYHFFQEVAKFRGETVEISLFLKQPFDLKDVVQA
jgi:hypothetical protein